MQKTDPQEIVKKLEWINKLPDGGGAWGMGVLATAEQVAGEVVALEAQIADVKASIRTKTRFLRKSASRAEKDAALLFPGNTDVPVTTPTPRKKTKKT